MLLKRSAIPPGLLPLCSSASENRNRSRRKIAILGAHRVGHLCLPRSKTSEIQIQRLWNGRASQSPKSDPVQSSFIMGRWSLRVKIVEQLIWYKFKVDQERFLRHWPEVAQKWVQSGFWGRHCEEKGPETHFGPTFGPLSANDENLFWTHLCAKLPSEALTRNCYENNSLRIILRNF